MSRIFNLSEAASIGLHSMILIGKSEGIINVAKIAEIIGSSRHHVAKVLQRLEKEGFVTSMRGPNGGFSLKKSVKKLNFLDIYEAIEGKIEISECPIEKHACPFEQCILNNITNEMTKQFMTYLKTHTLSKYI